MFNNYIIHFKAIINFTIAMVLVFSVFYIFRYLSKLVLTKKSHWFKAFNFKNNEIISKQMLISIILNIIKVIKWISVLSIIYLMIPFILQELPFTHDYAVTLMLSIKKNFFKIGNLILEFLPNVFFIAITLFLARSLIRFLKFIFLKISKEDIVIAGFYPEWGNTTFQLLRFIVYMFSLVIIYPYLPGAGTKALQGMSLFLGLLLSLGSSSAIANLIAGVMISYMRAFKEGDYVKIGESMGKVIERGIIVTKIMTYKNEEITIPNTQILSSQVTNYSTQAKNEDLILYTTLTIGYDTPWTLVQKMMIEAANRSSLINQNKKPFVLQTSLNDYHISYQLNAYTGHVESIPAVYSQLHQNLQQVFSENQVEIMSPGFTVFRNTPKNTTPTLK